MVFMCAISFRTAEASARSQPYPSRVAWPMPGPLICVYRLVTACVTLRIHSTMLVRS
jgi:hypothetical protein